MEALEFFREYKRLCKANTRSGYGCSEDCPMTGCRDAYFCNNEPTECADEILKDTIEMVEEWSQMNPVKTNLQVFQEVFGIGPCTIAPFSWGMPSDWWNQEYEGNAV